jgi:ribosomal protein S18 acetylase RimI-like enzyme
MSAASAEWTRDAFLERCLERPVFRLHLIPAASRAIAEAKASRSWMIEARVPVEQVESLALLTSQGFRIIDTNVQLDCLYESLTVAVSSPGDWCIRMAQSADRAAVQDIAALNLTTSRFHLDPRLGGQIAARVKREWVGNFFDAERGDHMFVVDTPAGVRGFLLVLERDALGVIDLVALEPGIRGTGAAGALVDSWRAASPHLERIVVGTQISNVRSLRAYGRLGFRVYAATHVLHRHPDNA